MPHGITSTYFAAALQGSGHCPAPHGHQRLMRSSCAGSSGGAVQNQAGAVFISDDVEVRFAAAVHRVQRLARHVDELDDRVAVDASDESRDADDPHPLGTDAPDAKQLGSTRADDLRRRIPYTPRITHQPPART